MPELSKKNKGNISFLEKIEFLISANNILKLFVLVFANFTLGGKQMHQFLSDSDWPLRFSVTNS